MSGKSARDRPMAMTRKEFIAWMAKHSLSFTGASEALGLSRRQIAHYVSGDKPIPRHIWLATKGYDVTAKGDENSN